MSQLRQAGLRRDEVHAAVEMELPLGDVVVAEPVPPLAVCLPRGTAGGERVSERMEREDLIETLCGLMERLSEPTQVASVELCCLAWLLCEATESDPKRLGRDGFRSLEYAAYRRHAMVTMLARAQAFAAKVLATDWAQERVLRTYLAEAAKVRASGTVPGRPTWCSAAMWIMGGGVL